MDELEILKIAHETDPQFTARTYYADILKLGKAIAAAEREAGATAILAAALECDDEAEAHGMRFAAGILDKRSNVEYTPK